MEGPDFIYVPGFVPDLTEPIPDVQAVRNRLIAAQILEEIQEELNFRGSSEG